MLSELYSLTAFLTLRRGDIMGFMQIFNENSKIMKNGFYMNGSNKKVDISDAAEMMSSKVYVLESTDTPEKISREKYFSVRENIVNCGSISAFHRLRSEGVNSEIILLNFANAMYPGGAYTAGGNAQEESLCRASMLYYSLKNTHGFYSYHRTHPTPLYSDRMIISRNVPVIRDDDGKLCDNYSLCSFITCAAVNKTFAKFICKAETINNAMDERIRKIVCASVTANPEALIFGAFGCGVFGNDREFVYNVFEKYINMFVSDDIRVVFAVK